MCQVQVSPNYILKREPFCQNIYFLLSIYAQEQVAIHIVMKKEHWRIGRHHSGDGMLKSIKYDVESTC